MHNHKTARIHLYGLIVVILLIILVIGTHL